MAVDSRLHSEPDELLRKAATKLRHHLETGQNCRAETVLNDFPSLASDPHRALELIVLEFQLRRDLGQNPDPRDWYERFPHWRDQLRARLEELLSSCTDRSQRETAALQTSPYLDADRQTLVDLDVDVPVLGRHAILEEINRGGMGVVYRARDLVLDRVVALKVIRSGVFASPDEVRRFYQEARAAAQLRHPNIVPIFGMGLYERQHCFTMALFPRGSLAQHLADYGQKMQDAVGLVIKVARAVQTAHERGIIHRDLKPGNILLDEGGEPVVSDFGLAKRLEASTTLTLPANPVGTPAYMAPEQVRCEVATAASDIWSLGIILYELLTGRVPFPGTASDEVRQKVLHTDPICPRRLRPDLPRDLETIILTCLEREPARRYKSAAALADDLERWLRGESIQARPEPRWQRLRRQFRRRVGMKGAVLLLTALLLMGTGAAGVWTLFVYLSPEAIEQRHQERVLASLQRELAEGRSVLLVDRVGPPKWYRWRTQKGRAPLPDLKHWPLQLDSVQGPLLFELLPDPQQVSYRLSAEVRPNGEKMAVGLYFAGEELATPAGPEHCFGLFRLYFEHLAVTDAGFLLVGFVEKDVNQQTVRHEIIPPFNGQRALFPKAPLPPAPKETPWRRIEVHATPVDIKAFCDGRLMDDYIFSNGQKKLARMWRATHPPVFPLPTFPLRGCLGLYVDGGPAQFRNIVVEPLPQP